MPQIFKKFLRQMSGELGGEKHDDSRRGRGLVQNSVGGYQRVPSNGTISTSTTSASLVTDYDPQHHKSFTPSFPVEEEDNNQSPDEEEDFERTRLYFQQSKQISIDSAKKFKLEMDEKTDNKSENIRNTVPFVTQISTDRIKKDDFSINGDGSPYKSTTQKINFQSQLQAAIAVSLGSMVVGFTTAYTSPGLASMQHENSTLTITKSQGSWVGGLMPLAALVGGLLGGFLIVHLGRRNTILATAIPFIASWITIAEASTVYVVYIGRALGGLCVGIGSLAFPVYLGEALQAEVRGQLGLLPTALGNIGILLCFTAGKYLDWSLLAYMGAFLPLPFLLLTMLIPETPHWYISKGNKKEAEKSLEKLRGKDADINNELDDIIKSHQESKENENSSIWDLFRSENRRPVLISLGLMFFQQMSGINAVIFYTVSIFQSAGSTIDENWCTIIVGIVNFGATFVATFLIDRLGRKMLLYISSLSMIVMLGILGTFFFVQSLEYDTSAYGWLPLISFVVYVIGFSLGFGPIPWLMMGEILPGRVKGSAASVATAFNWTCTFIVTKTFQDLIDGIGSYGAFWLFGVVCIFGFIFTIIFVPETKGKSLEDIEKQLSRKK